MQPTPPSDAAGPASAGASPAAEHRPMLDLEAIEPPTPMGRVIAFVRDDWRSAAGGVVAIAVVGVIGWVLLRPDPPRSEDLIPLAAPTVAPAVAPGTMTTSTLVVGPILVHAAGAVVAPGLYELEAGDRVADLVRAAGGPAPGADLDRLNLAAALIDGTQVYVPEVGEQVVPAPLDPTGSSSTTALGADEALAGGGGGLVDLNRASLDELDELPGVGPATAQAIVDHRTTVGPFTTVDELLDVRGIGEAKLADLRPLVMVG